MRIPTVDPITLVGIFAAATLILLGANYAHAASATFDPHEDIGGVTAPCDDMSLRDTFVAGATQNGLSVARMFDAEDSQKIIKAFNDTEPKSTVTVDTIWEIGDDERAALLLNRDKRFCLLPPMSRKALDSLLANSLGLPL